MFFSLNSRIIKLYGRLNLPLPQSDLSSLKLHARWTLTPLYGQGPPLAHSSNFFWSGWHDASYIIKSAVSSADTEPHTANSTAVGAGNCVLDKFALDKFAPYKSAPDKFALDKFAPYKFAPDKSAPDKFALDKSAPDKFALDKFAPYKFAPDKFAPDKSAPDKFALDKFAPDKFAPDKSALDKSAPDKSAPDKFALDKFAPDKFALDKSAPDKFALDKFAPDKFAPDKSALDKSALALTAASALNRKVAASDLKITSPDHRLLISIENSLPVHYRNPNNLSI
jgi:hypothetical protein